MNHIMNCYRQTLVPCNHKELVVNLLQLSSSSGIFRSGTLMLRTLSFICHTFVYTDIILCTSITVTSPQRQTIFLVKSKAYL